MANPEGGFNFELKEATSHQTADHKHVYILSNWGVSAFEWLTELLPMVWLKQPDRVKGKRTGGNAMRDPATHSKQLRRTTANPSWHRAGITICWVCERRERTLQQVTGNKHYGSLPKA